MDASEPAEVEETVPDETPAEETTTEADAEN
jgi:hypothetical protein